MSSISENVREIYLVFMNTFYFGDSFIKDGFKHVYCIERQELGWVCLDPSQTHIYNYILPAAYEIDVMSEFKKRNPEFIILKLLVKPHDKSAYPRPGLVSCVSTMQYLLGIYWPFIFTPYQLYNKMLRKPPKHIEVIHV